MTLTNLNFPINSPNIKKFYKRISRVGFGYVEFINIIRHVKTVFYFVTVGVFKRCNEYNDGINGWQPYNPENPPEKTGHNFTIRVTSADMPEGVIVMKAFRSGSPVAGSTL